MAQGALPLRSLQEAQSLREELRDAALSAAMERFVTFQAGKPRGWRPETVRVSRTAYRTLLRYVGDCPARALTFDDTDRAMLAAYSAGYSPQWVECLRGKWKTLVRFLLRSRVLTVDISIPWEATSWDEDQHERLFHDYTREEIARLCEHLTPAMGKYVWGSCYAGGLRLSNHRALTWSKIATDWVIVIPASEMKGRKEFRWPVTLPLRAIIGPRGAPGDPVYGRLPCRRNINTKLKQASRKAGLDPAWAYPHQFRRTCCAWLKKAGVTRDEAMRLFGWTSENLMLRHYWPKETDDERRAILDKML